MKGNTTINITVCLLQLVLFFAMAILYYKYKKIDITVPIFVHVLSYIVSIALLVSMAPVYNHVHNIDFKQNIALMNES